MEVNDEISLTEDDPNHVAAVLPQIIDIRDPLANLPTGQNNQLQPETDGNDKVAILSQVADLPVSSEDVKVANLVSGVAEVGMSTDANPTNVVYTTEERANDYLLYRKSWNSVFDF